MNHLLRALAPISDAGWTALDDEARERLVPALAARRLVEFDGPRGWTYGSRNLGRTTVLGEPAEEVTALRRVVLPPGSSCARISGSREPSSRTSTAGPTTSTWTTSTAPLTGSRRPRTPPC